MSAPLDPDGEKGKAILGTGFYRDAAPGTFGPSEWLDLLMACQDGRTTCMRVMEYIERETVPVLCAQSAEAMLDRMTDAFLRWPLPDSVCADGCATKQGSGRVGTNLLTAIETKEMLRAVVLPLIPATLARASQAEAALADLEKSILDLSHPNCRMLLKERDEWKACAERTDAKMLHEQRDHNKTVDQLIAANATIDDLLREVERCKDGLLPIWAQTAGSSILAESRKREVQEAEPMTGKDAAYIIVHHFRAARARTDGKGGA